MLRELSDKDDKNGRKRHLKSEFALFQTFLVFTSSIKREIRKFHVVVVHYDSKNGVMRASVVSEAQTCCFSAVLVAVDVVVN